MSIKNDPINGIEFIKPGDIKKITDYEWEMYIKKRRMTINLRNAAQDLLNTKIQPPMGNPEQEKKKNTAVEILVGLCLLSIDKSALVKEVSGSQENTSNKSGWFKKSKQWFQGLFQSNDANKSISGIESKKNELNKQWKELTEQWKELDESYRNSDDLVKILKKDINDNNIINISLDEKVYKLIKDKTLTTPSDGTKNEIEKENDSSVPNNLWGLALPGGGIRSATFVLGVMQGLMQKSSLFPKGAFRYFDYMSSVSGGGYMGACLSSLLTVTDNDDTLQKNKAHFGVEADNSPFVDDKEPTPYLNPNPIVPNQPIQFSKRDQLHHLRSHASYLSTEASALSAAKQRMFGSIAAGMVHNLVVFAALFIALVASLHLSLSFFDKDSRLIINDTPTITSAIGLPFPFDSANETIAKHFVGSLYQTTTSNVAANIPDTNKVRVWKNTVQPMYDFCPVWARDAMKNVFVWFGEVTLQIDRLYYSKNNPIYFITFGTGALWVLFWVIIAHFMRKRALKKINDLPYTQKLKPGDTVIDDVESKLVTRFNSTSILIIVVLAICVIAGVVNIDKSVSLLLCPLFFALGAYLTLLLLLTHPRESFVSQNGITVRSFYDILKGGALYGLIGSIVIPIGLILAASTNSLALALLSPVTLGLAAYIVFFGQVKKLQRSYKLLLNIFVGFSLAFLLAPTSAFLLDLYQPVLSPSSNISLQARFVEVLSGYFPLLQDNIFSKDWISLYSFIAIGFQVCAYTLHTIPQVKGREVRMKIQGWLHTLTIFFGFTALLLSPTAPKILTITFLIFGIVHCVRRKWNDIISLSQAVLYTGMTILAVWIIWNYVPDSTFFPPIYTIILSGIDIALLLTIFVDSNRTAPHYFYRDRLTEAFLRTEARVERNNFKEKQGAALFMVRNDEDLNLKDLGENTQYNTYNAPYHIINAAINLGGSDELVRKSHKSDHFMFSKYYVGSSVTGYVPTKRYGTHENGIRLAKAMTIAGAAAGSGMGIYTFLGQRFLMTLFNVRLGQWIENPWWYHKLEPNASIVPVNSNAERLIESKWTFWLYYLVREIMGWTNARERLVNVSDGGHTGDNLGMLALFHRRCRVVVVVDSEKDEKYTFGSFNNAVRLALVEQNININIDLTPLIPDWNKKSDNKLNMSTRSVAVGTIHYPKRPEDTEEFVGTLIYLRASVSEWNTDNTVGEKELVDLLSMIRNDVYPKSPYKNPFIQGAKKDWNLPAHVENYNRTHEDFPNQSTLNQFYDTEEFEAYRALGEHVAKQAYPILYEIAQH